MTWNETATEPDEEERDYARFRHANNLLAQEETIATSAARLSLSYC